MTPGHPHRARRLRHRVRRAQLGVRGPPHRRPVPAAGRGGGLRRIRAAEARDRDDRERRHRAVRVVLRPPETAGCARRRRRTGSPATRRRCSPRARSSSSSAAATSSCTTCAATARARAACSRPTATFDKEDQMAVIDWLMKRPGCRTTGSACGACRTVRRRRCRLRRRGPALAFVIADASYSSMPDIAAVQADKQIGVWARRSSCRVRSPSPDGGRGSIRRRRRRRRRSAASRRRSCSSIRRRTHSRRPSSSEAIFAAADPSRTRLILTRYGAPHGESFWTAPIEYAGYVDTFLDDFVPRFWRAASGSGQPLAAGSPTAGRLGPTR